MEMEKSEVLIQFPVIFRHFGDVLSFPYARRLRGYTETVTFTANNQPRRFPKPPWHLRNLPVTQMRFNFLLVVSVLSSIGTMPIETYEATLLGNSDVEVIVAAYLRGMRPTSSIDKDIPAINEKLKTQNYNINQTHK